MRPQDPLPDWTTHLALIHQDGTVHTGTKQEVLGAESSQPLHNLGRFQSAFVHKSTSNGDGSPFVNFNGVNVAYGDRKASAFSLTCLLRLLLKNCNGYRS